MQVQILPGDQNHAKRKLCVSQLGTLVLAKLGTHHQDGASAWQQSAGDGNSSVRIDPHRTGRYNPSQHPYIRARIASAGMRSPRWRRSRYAMRCVASTSKSSTTSHHVVGRCTIARSSGATSGGSSSSAGEGASSEPSRRRKVEMALDRATSDQGIALSQHSDVIVAA